MADHVLRALEEALEKIKLDLEYADINKEQKHEAYQAAQVWFDELTETKAALEEEIAKRNA